MKKKILYTSAAILSLFILAFAYYTLSPLFINIKVNEKAPETNINNSKNENSIQEKNISANIIGTVGHPASGTVKIIKTEGKDYIRYEDFKTLNGPDLYVYLSKDLEAKDYINIGEVRATEGNINYNIPDGVNIDEYRYVLTWCKAFGVLFNYADLENSDF